MQNTAPFSAKSQNLGSIVADEPSSFLRKRLSQNLKNALLWMFVAKYAEFVIRIFLRHSCVRRNPVAELVILHSVAGRRMIKSVLDQLLCSGYFLLFRLRMHSHAGAWERRKHPIWQCLLWLFSGFLRAQE